MTEIPVFFVKCACYVWPVTALYPMGRCGWCGEVPEETVDAPTSGKAEPL